MVTIFRENNYVTQGIVSHYFVGSRLGFDQGFDYFVESWQEKWNEKAGDSPFYNRAGKVKQFTNATIMVDQALKWLRNGAQPSDSVRDLFRRTGILDRVKETPAGG